MNLLDKGGKWMKEYIKPEYEIERFTLSPTSIATLSTIEEVAGNGDGEIDF